MKSFDVIVVGAGGLGSACFYYLTKSGLKTCTIDQYDVPHSFGSSHGDVRMFRQAYFEDTRYIPLLIRSKNMWQELDTSEKLFHQVGLLTMSDGGENFNNTLKAAKEYAISIEEIDNTTLQKTYPFFGVPDSFKGVLEKEAGYLEVEKCQTRFINKALTLGGELIKSKVLHWKSKQETIEVLTSDGPVEASHVVLATGAWSKAMWRQEKMDLKIERAVQFWVDPIDKNECEHIPCFAFDVSQNFYYGFPYRKGLGLKVAGYRPSFEIEDPDLLERTPSDSERDEIKYCVNHFLKKCHWPPIKESLCMYTSAYDENFIIDWHPQHKNVLCVGSGSGHSYKFAPVIGEAVSELIGNGQSKSPIDFLKWRVCRL